MGMGSAIAAVAASLAALLAGVNLYMSGRREQAKWRRDTLVDVFVDFLKSSFEISDAADEIILTTGSSSPGTPTPVHRSKLRELHDQQTALLTRMRLLADRGSLEAAQNLHLVDHARADSAIAVASASQPVVVDPLTPKYIDARHQFVIACRPACVGSARRSPDVVASGSRGPRGSVASVASAAICVCIRVDRLARDQRACPN